MCKLLKIKGFLLIVFSLFIFTNNVFAKECYEKSPNLIQLKDKYYELESNKKISDKDRDLLNELYSNVNGKWKGGILYTDCKGPDKAPRKKLREVNASAEFITTNYLLIELKWNPNDSRISKQLTYKLLKEGERIFNFKIKDKNNLVFSEIIRKSNGKNKGSRLVESIYDLELNGDALKFNLIHYVNGVFVGDEQWSMERN